MSPSRLDPRNDANAATRPVPPAREPLATRLGFEAPARGRQLAAALGLALVSGCAHAPSWIEPPPPDAPPDALVVRLIFGEGADLDLYVTGPSQETVYYANAEARDGGRLDGDERCDAPAPRVETVLYAEAEAGSYRVGIDFPESCEGDQDPVPYVVQWRAPGAGPGRLEGVGRFGRFDSRVIEIPVTPR